MSTPALAPLAIDVTLPVDDSTALLEHDPSAWDADTWTVDRVQWRARASKGLHPDVADGVTVEVVAFARRLGAGHGVQSWYLTPETVHPDLRQGPPPPAWVPPAPAWFDQVVAQMRGTVSAHGG